MVSKISWNSATLTVLLFVLCSGAAAYVALDPNGNITIKWDVLSWTPDGYVAVVTMSNFQIYRPIMSPGWTLGWTWAKNEVIWAMMGAQATDQGDCSKFKTNIPHSCEKNPEIVDLLPDAPYNQQVANCCKGGVLASGGKDPSDAVSAFQITVGSAGTTNRTVKLPKNFTLDAPGGGYICGPAKIVSPSLFITPDRRRVTRAMNLFYMCPINVHWHVNSNYKRFWGVKITITNLNYGFNYTQWTLVVQHPFLNNATQVPAFSYKPVMHNLSTNDTALFYGRKPYTDVLMQAGPNGNVRSDLTLNKDGEKTALNKGWAFPRRVYFNGNPCVMPSPESYAVVPNPPGLR